MPRRIVLISIALILGVCSIPISDLVVSYASMSIEKPMPGVLVKYYRSIFTPQIFKIVIENTSGQRYPTTISLFAWMPNGSIVELGKFFGRKGATSINLIKIVEFLKTWYRYLVAHENNPALIEPSIIIMGAIHTPLGVYGVVRSVPLDMIKILKGFTTEIRIVENMTKKNILIPINEVEKYLRRVRLGEGFAKRGAQGFSTWPPKEMYDCVCDEVGCYCCVWRLEKVYAVREKGVPLVMAYVHGDGLKSVGYGRLFIELSEYFVAKERFGIRVSFGIVAAIRLGNGEIEYEIPGFVMELGGEDHVWLNYFKAFSKGRDFDSDAILAIGLIADLAFARYRLTICDPYMCYDTDVYANMTLSKPYIENNEIEPWMGMDTNPHDNVGELERILQSIEKWNESKPYIGTEIRLSMVNIEHDLSTSPLFSSSIAVLPILLSNAPETLPLLALISTSIGLTKEGTSMQEVYCSVLLGQPATYAVVVYAYSPTEFDYGCKKYAIGTLYTDVMIYEYPP